MIAEGDNLTRKEDPAKIYDWGSTEQAKAHMEWQWNISKEDRDKVVRVDEIEADGVVMSEEELLDKLAA